MTDKILNAGMGYVVRPIEVYHGTNEKKYFHQDLTNEPVSAYDNLIEFIHNRLLHVQHLAIISALVEL